MALVINKPQTAPQLACDGRQYAHRYPKLISREIFDQCQFITQQRHPSESKAKYNSKTYIFKSLVRCGLCSRTVSAVDARNNVYLKCSNASCKNLNTAEALLLPSISKALQSLAMPTQVARDAKIGFSKEEPGKAPN